MTPVVFQSGIPAVCQNWPEYPQNLCKCPIRCVAHKHKEVDCRWQYDHLRAASIASAIPFVESDRETVKEAAWEFIVMRDKTFHSFPYENFYPQDGTVYMISAEVDRFNQSAWNRVFNQTGIEFVKKQHPNWEFRQVMRLTPPDKKEPPNPLIVVGNLGPIISFGCSFPKCNCQNGMEKCKEQREAVEPDSGKGEKPVFDDIIKFLLGETSFYGVHFGDKHPTEPGQYWWRKHLRSHIDRLNKLNTVEVREGESQEELRLRALINHPEIDNFLKGVQLEAAHQTERWGLENEEQKAPHHFVMVVMKIAGKMCVDVWDRDFDKFKHHCIALAAEMFNIHRQTKKESTVIHQWFTRKDGEVTE